MHSLRRARCWAHPILILASAITAACATDATTANDAASMIDSTSLARNGQSASAAKTTAAVAVTLSRPQIYGANQTTSASAVPSDANGQPLTGKSIEWSTSDSRIATINKNGVATSLVKTGQVNIIATIDGVRGTAPLTIVDSTPPSQYAAAIVVTLVSPTMQVGQTSEAKVMVYDANGNRVTGRRVAMSSSNPSVATVNPYGVVTAVSGGSATISASIDGRVGSAQLTVGGAAPVSVSSVSVALDSSAMIVGSTSQATATLRDSSGTILGGRSITWSSNNTAVATVSSSGVVTAVGPGIAGISATSESKSGSANVTINAVPAASVQVTLNPGYVLTGQAAMATAVVRDAKNNVLTGRLITWSSSATSVATVASSGAIAAVATGTANITAVVEGKTGAAMLTVGKVPVSTVTVSLASTSIAPGKTTQASAVTKDSTGTVLSGRTIAWTSSNTAVATVNATTGVVTAVATGSANIIATSEGRTGLMAVTVAPAAPIPVATVSVSVSAPTLSIGQNTQATAVTKDSTGATLTGRTIAWSSSNTAVATVSNSGVVTAVGAGSANIAATSEGKMGMAPITVAQIPVATVSVSVTSASLTVGQSTQASAVTRDANNNVLTGRAIAWASSNSSVASVSSAGVVSAVSAGSASITATSEGKTGAVTVTVTSTNISTGSSGLSGTVTENGAAVGGGVVEIWSGSTLVQTLPVNGNGSFSTNTLSAGTYGVRLHPTLNYSLGSGEPFQRSVTISGSQGVSVPFAVQKSLASDDFQSYSSTSQILAFCTGGARPGDFWYGPGRDGNCNTPGQSYSGFDIAFDPTGGPNGSKALRYDWGSRPSCPNGPTACSVTVDLYPRLNPMPAMGSELWIRFTDKLSTGFKAGGGGAVSSQIEYKYLFLDMYMPQTGSTGQFQVELENAIGGTAVSDFALRTKIVDYKNVATTSDRHAIPAGPGDYRLGSNFAGQWHTWVFGITGIGTSAVTFTAYLDGKQVQQITGPWFPGLAIAQGAVLGIQMGANINNGPDQAQSRWWREIGVYRTRPSLVP